MGKFTPLTEWLRRRTGNSVGLTFAQIEEIIAPNELPDSARKYFAWWARYGEGKGISKAYSDAGFELVMIDKEYEKVRFRRI